MSPKLIIKGKFEHILMLTFTEIFDELNNI